MVADVGHPSLGVGAAPAEHGLGADVEVGHDEGEEAGEVDFTDVLVHPDLRFVDEPSPVADEQHLGGLGHLGPGGLPRYQQAFLAGDVRLEAAQALAYRCAAAFVQRYPAQARHFEEAVEAAFREDEVVLSVEVDPSVELVRGRGVHDLAVGHVRGPSLCHPLYRHSVAAEDELVRDIVAPGSFRKVVRGEGVALLHEDDVRVESPDRIHEREDHRSFVPLGNLYGLPILCREDYPVDGVRELGDAPCNGDMDLERDLSERREPVIFGHHRVQQLPLDRAVERLRPHAGERENLLLEEVGRRRKKVRIEDAKG